MSRSLATNATWGDGWSWAGVVPLLLWCGAFFLPGLGALLLMSIGEYSLSEHMVGANGWEELRTDRTAQEAVLASVRLAALAAALNTMLGLPVGLALRFAVKGSARVVALAILLLPAVSSLVVRSFAMQLWLGRQGILVAGASALGLSERALLNTPLATYLGWMVAQVPLVGIVHWLALAQLSDAELEAAKNLGARPFAVFGSFLLPRLVPGLVAGGVLCFALSFSDLIAPSILGGGSVYTASMALADMIKINALAEASALALVLGSVTVAAYIVLIVLAMWLLRPREHSTA